MAQKGDQIAADDHDAVAFSLDLLVKDLALATDAASRDLPVTEAALALARQACAGGRGAADYAGLVNDIERRQSGSRQSGSRQSGSRQSGSRQSGSRQTGSPEPGRG
jgi:hypothetical protein